MKKAGIILKKLSNYLRKLKTLIFIWKIRSDTLMVCDLQIYDLQI
jgi:hypothetical protein